MPKVKSSAVWNFFQPKPDSDGIASCNICKNELSYKATSNNLRRHIQRKHPFAVLGEDIKTQEISVVVATENTSEDINLVYPEAMELELQAAADNSQVASCSKDPLGQNFIENLLKRKNKKSTIREINDALLRLFTLDFQPFSIVEEAGFKSFVSTLNSTYQLPSRKTITDSFLPSAYEEAYNASRNILDDIPSVTLTTDCWSSTQSYESFVAITAHFININFEKKSILLECSSFGKSPTSANLYTEIARVVNEWNLHEKVLIVVSNNSNSITKAVTDLGLQHFGCFAYKLDLIAQDVLKLIIDSVDKVRTIVGHFKRNMATSAKFMHQQKQAGLLPKHLIQSVPKQWNSAFYMLERFTELEEPLRTTMALINKNCPTITIEEWRFFSEIVKIIKPLETVTKIMCEEKYITASSVIILTDGLVDVYSNLNKQNFTQSAKNIIASIQKGLTTKLGDLEGNESLVLTTFLDPRFKNIGFSNEITANVAKEQIEASLTQLIHERGEGVAQPIREAVDLDDSIWSKFDKKIASSHPIGNAHSKAVLEVQRYLEEPPIPRNEDPLLWWKNNSFNLPHLSELARLKFIPVATSVPCERLFTKSGQLLTERRNRLSSSEVKSVLFLNTMNG
ncbi:zinc finger BED domain-containing protein 1-like [Anoplophora glabripennis]|uniref:zinc finger BED domain-containing protein 1-like n=1 Tax=Anoplophora glabripennis TaxID=217634 RepID=UPI0008753DAF|nr:zinc finger BED domain-containing protein 1-like [Anoplophora glabripennis]